jgi:hypothetical protein
MKAMLRDAVEKGYDKIAWTTGKMQQDRWSLTRHFPDLGWHVQPDESVLGKYSVGDATRVTEDNAKDFVFLTGLGGSPNAPVRLSNLEDYVGQTAADHIRQQIQAGVTTGDMRDVKSGGEWAENLYDKQIPTFMRKYTEKWGGKVSKTTIGAKTRGTSLPVLHGQGVDPHDMMIETENGWMATHPGTGEEHTFATEDQAARTIQRWYKQKVKDAPTEVWSLDITPAMRGSILHEGQPLWSTIPFVADTLRRHMRGNLNSQEDNR